jgi:DNA helicase II / ATP-dependent DNA helicase PcrA
MHPNNQFLFLTLEFMQSEAQLKKYNEIYATLNAEQKRAVDTIEGPVMVIAGPGTGKTQILSSRIGKILLETDALAQNILCLTYTDAGVVAMRKRLLSFIGVDAYKVNICTFHAFCNDVIQDNLSLFQKNILEPITDLESIDLFRELIDAFPKGHTLKRYRGDVYYEIFNLKSLFALLKKEGWSIADIEKRCDAYIAELPTKEGFYYKRKYKQFNAGDVKQDKIDAEIEKIAKLKAALGEYEHFNALMQKNNRYDFDDMINWVITAFTENKNLLAQYQEQYLYILVDEYQDTSGTQNKIIELLINYWGDNPNVFVVGDDDQSIFRFQGANVANMEAFANTYSSTLEKIVLTQNYRSTQPILDIAKQVIEHNEDRLVKKMPGLTKELIAANKKINHLTHTPNIYCYETQHQEMVHTVLEIEKLIAQNIDPKKIAVIYKENKYGETLANYFNLKNIPYYSKRSMDLFAIPLAKKIIHVLYYLASEMDVPYSGDEMLFELLHFDWFTIKPIAIAQETIEVADAKYDKTNKIHSLRQLLADKASKGGKDLFDIGLNPEIKKVSDTLEKLLKDAANETLQTLFQNILNELDILGYIMRSEEKHWNLQIITSLFNLVKEETHRKPTLNLTELVNILQTMQTEGLTLPLYQINGTDKGVNLLTNHGSKGLEFEHVFMLGVNAHVWEKKTSKGTPYGIAKYLRSQVGEEEQEEKKLILEELRRLFYVALTRAETNLTVSYFKFKADAKEVEPSMFIAEMMADTDLAIETIAVDEATMDAFTILEIANSTKKPIIQKIEEDFITRNLEKFTMNVTALNAYLNCPLGFYYRNLIRIPSPKNESTEFGSAVHYALDQLFKKMLDSGSTVSERKFATKAIFIQDFEWYMHKHRESFTKEQFKKRMEYGPMILSDYYDKYVDGFEKVVVVERRISKVVVKGVPLKGAIDKIEFNGKQVNVVDYKTGDYEKAKKTKKQFDPPNEKNEHGGDYWRQAVFYKLLIDNYPLKDWKVISSEFDFIEPNNQKEYFKEKITITPEDLTTVTQQIVTVWQKIQNREFYTGCGKETCHWCNFVKDNKLAIGFEEEEPAALQLPERLEE